ncbi:unnamed protein product [Rotaria sp. Silwood2]|nr:unnamed protein product [Rotaria sp. Silwood2]
MNFVYIWSDDQWLLNINHERQKCLSLFQQMKTEYLTINEPISISLIGACSQIGIRSISEYIVNQIPHLSSNSYGKSGDINQARKVFQSIIKPDIITYNSMINAYAQNGMGYAAIDLYNQIFENIHDKISHICVLNACSHSGLIDQARIIFNKIHPNTEDIIVAMIVCLSRMGMFDEAQEIINNYEKFNKPSLIMYNKDIINIIYKID